MNKELLDKIQELNFWYKEQDTGLGREELKKIMKFTEDKGMALVIAGVRRAGKTFLAKQILTEKLKEIKPEQTLIINFEDPSLGPFLNVESLQELYQTYRYFVNKEEVAYVVLDEVHNVPNWEKWVRIMMEKNEKIKFIITGSSSKIYKDKISTVLSGRTVVFSLFSLSFRNFLSFKKHHFKTYESYASVVNLLHEYLEYGGFPLIVLAQEEVKKEYLKQLFEDILVKDIIAKYKLRELEIKKLAVILINNFSSLISVGKLEKLMQEIAKTKMSPTSINNYLYYFEEAFLFFFVPIFSYKIKEQMQYPRKAYCIDSGLINALSLKFSENIGKLYENTVALDIFRKYGKDNLFYWKDSSGREVDFIVKEGLEIKQLIQVCYDLSKTETKEREIRSLLAAMEEFKLEEGMVITENYEAEEEVKGKKIKFIPLWKWLL
ncbi:ATP-binding protein [Candidatus Woesearchaeota archaeon]|nr:ATP-binding protein [Candidatus Woesearchaeota archaeon]